MEVKHIAAVVSCFTNIIDVQSRLRPPIFSERIRYIIACFVIEKTVRPPLLIEMRACKSVVAGVVFKVSFMVLGASGKHL